MSRSGIKATPAAPYVSGKEVNCLKAMLVSL